MERSKGRKAKALAEVAFVFVALFITAALIGLVAGSLPKRFATPVQALALWGAIGAGALMLRREGRNFGALGMRRPRSWRDTLVWAAIGLVAALAGSVGLGEAIKNLTDWPPLDVSYIRNSLEGDTFVWATWMLLVVWGSAAFGEELLSRGFVLDRFRQAFGESTVALGWATVLQAVIFGLLHTVQGPTGVVITAYVGLVFAAVYIASGWNLWAAILAHGIADSVSLTLIYAGLPLPGYIS
ncbi:MAG: CPBP family intramembrane glutamic endopeptidase [Sphingomicrobium sp.]